MPTKQILGRIYRSVCVLDVKSRHTEIPATLGNEEFVSAG